MAHAQPAVAVVADAGPLIYLAGAPPSPELLPTLGRGEAAAIPLAERLHATMLRDDAAARAAATRRGLHVVGTLGVLLLAKNRRLLPSAGAVIDAMRQHGCYVADALVREVFAAAGEPPPPSAA